MLNLLSPTQAISLVKVDLATLTPAQRLTTRYLYDTRGGIEWVKNETANLNRISRNTDTIRPIPLANNRLLRVDLTQLCFDLTQLQEYIDTWEELRFDPTMNLILTSDVFNVILGLPVDKQPLVIGRLGPGKYGKWKFNECDQNVDVIRITILPLDTVITTLSCAFLVEGHYFDSRALSSIKDKGAFAQIWGGLSYEFNGIKRSKDQKVQTDEDLFFQALGIGNKQQKAQEIFDNLHSEQRIALFRSGVTDKSRQIDFLPILNRRIGDGVSGVSVTHDVRDQDIQTMHHALMSLRKKIFRDFAREVIFIKANGFNGYCLFNAQGVLQDEVPFDVANDSSIPHPHTQRLQSSISCIRCHESAGHSGWIPAQNDVMTLLENGADVFGDVSEQNKAIFETLNDLKSQYRGKPDKFFTAARNGFQEAMVSSTGLWKGNPINAVTEAGKYLESSYNNYNFARVTPSIALQELGFEAVPDKEAIKFLKVLLKPDQNSRVFGIVPEDVRIFALTHDIPIYRKDFAMIFQFAQYRVEQLRRNQP